MNLTSKFIIAGSVGVISGAAITCVAIKAIKNAAYDKGFKAGVNTQLVDWKGATINFEMDNGQIVNNWVAYPNPIIVNAIANSEYATFKINRINVTPQTQKK